MRGRCVFTAAPDFGCTEINMTLNTAFKQVFGEGLKEYGFVKVKGRQPYLARVMPGNEIVQIVSVSPDREYKPGFKAFNVLCGTATVYRQSIDLTVCPHDSTPWLKALSHYFLKANSPLNAVQEALHNSIRSFRYEDNDNALMNTLERACRHTARIMLPIFDSAADIPSCYEHFRYYGNASLPLYDETNSFNNENPNNYYTEGLLVYLLKDRQELLKGMESRKDAMKRNIGTFYTQDDLERFTEKLEAVKAAGAFDPAMHEKAFAELERRRAHNLLKLKEYGLITEEKQ